MSQYALEKTFPPPPAPPTLTENPEVGTGFIKRHDDDTMDKGTKDEVGARWTTRLLVLYIVFYNNMRVYESDADDDDGDGIYRQ